MNQSIDFIWITDIHLSEKSRKIVRWIWEQTLDECRKLNCQTLVLGGDIFTSRSGQSQEILKDFEEMLDEAAENSIHVIAIPGNHDKTDYTSTDSFLIPFKTHPCFSLVDEYDSLERDNVKYHLIPFFDEKLSYGTYLNRAVENKDSKKKNYLLTHVAIDGARNNDGSKVEGSLNISNLFDLIIVGHYHDRQWAAENVLYTGSPYQANYGEDTHKGIFVFYKDGAYEPVQLTFPKYIVINATRSAFVDHDRDFANEVKAAREGDRNNVKIIIETNDELPSEIIKEWRESGVKIEKKRVSDKKTAESATEIIEFNPSELVKHFELWGKDNPQEHFETGRQILKQACGI